ncbi:TIGR04255 family protein [Rugamonas sp. CCM 8940]|uniref:TIGR04255 family protein n=1 Tax=Rugamonas sp. CCM 8940 TaxID=2765359 RepID=UPI0018F54D8B|nr:TIGR04255 family protein [Rugamonas sp. CCM 8940]MBJ7313344.1 TIGR04255 family protein [Rugamonas sp. CCM 8940]
MLGELLVKPAAGKHAIEVMALAVEWGVPVSSDVIAAIRALHDGSALLREFLPRAEALQELTVSIGKDGPSVGMAEAGGLQLSRHSADGKPTWLVQARPDLLSCSCMEYDRWEATKPKALDVLMPLIALVAAQDYPMQAVGVQYQDAFRVDTNSPIAATRQLFLDGTAWLSPRIWSEDAPWHIHQGWFSAGMDGRLVHNVMNVDLTTDEQGCLLRINGQHRMLERGHAKGASVIPIQPSDVALALDSLHIENKRVLVQLLSQSVCDQIGLKVLETK